MARARRNRVKQNANRAAQPVYTVDANDSVDSVKVNRTFAALDSSLSLINTMIETNSFLPLGTSANQGATSFGGFTTTVDFAAFASEYKLFRIKAMQFDVYDTSPGSAGTAYFSTQHINVGGSLTTTMNGVTAAIDVGIVPPGSGMKSFTWVAKTNDELTFQACNGTIQDFGGLVYYAPAAPAAVANRYTIICKAHVQFRSRV